ncbi:MAG: amidohydrolase/deacetylase family metallohydrolase [Balneolaceae bacterium]
MTFYQRLIRTFATVALICGVTASANAQSWDLLIKDGHLIDARNGIDEVMDVAIADGKVARVGSNLSEEDAVQVVDASGMVVSPGFIDLHAHYFWGTEPNRYLSNSYSALPPDGFTFRSGVTTAVDVGGAGWRNFDQFKRQVIDRSQTRILSFVNIVGDGMSGEPEQDIDDMNPRMAARAVQNNEEVVGIKVAHFRGYNWEPYQRAARAGVLADVPVMIDLGSQQKVLPLDHMFFEVFRPGDILTHTYGSPVIGTVGFKEGALDENGQVREHWIRAQENGFIFDVGHGGGSFFYEIAKPATEQGFWPNTISTDIHTGSMNGGMKGQDNVISKFLNLGMPLADAIAATTWEPAKVISREDLGHLSEGAEADITIFTVREGEFGFIDVRGNVEPGDRKLEIEATFRAGRMVYDLNGIASVPQ